MSGISVLILTRNEQRDLQGCLESVAWSNDVHVYDSGSEDNTVEIAVRWGAHVTERRYSNSLPFGGDEAAHRNWGLRNIPFKHPWVFTLDADERVTPELAEEMRRCVALAPVDTVAFSVQRRDFFWGTWLRHVQTSPFYVRLFRPEKVSHERLINTVVTVNGHVERVGGYLDHYPFSKGIDYWITRHNGYSYFEARQIVANRSSKAQFNWAKAFTARDFHERRFHQKELFYRLPLRPLAKFLILYFGKRGILDGRAGFTYAVLQSIYEYFIVLKVRELSGDKP